MKSFETIAKARIITRIKFMLNKPSGDYFNMLLLAYNRWQEDEHSGVDYIFNINNPDDLIDCIKGGLTADEIAKVLNAGVIPRGKTLSEVNLVQNLANAVKMRDGKPISLPRITKLHAILSANLKEEGLAPELRAALEKRITEFQEKIKAGFYPFEQCVLFYQDMQDLMADETVFLEEIYASLLAGFGYILFPADAPSFEEAVSFVRSANPGLEREVRRFNEEKFRVKAGGKQKQLELF